MPRWNVPTAVFDMFVDGDLVATVEAESRNDAGRLLRTETSSEYVGVRWQGRVKVKVREHTHEPSAGNISVCVFCQERIEQGA